MKNVDDPSYVPPRFLTDVKHTFQSVKERTYELMRLRPGDAALDVGCGPASDTLALAAIVGPTGSVVGIDKDSGMIAAANEYGSARQFSNVEHIHVSAAELPFGNDTFAACRSERVFQHLPDPAQVLAEITRVLRPGGYAVLADPEFASMSSSAEDTALLWGMTRAMSDFLPNGYAACRNYGLLKRGQFEDVAVDVVPIVFHDYEAFGVLLRARVADILKMAGFPGARFSEFEADARQQSARGQFFACINMVVTSGRKGGNPTS